MQSARAEFVAILRHSAGERFDLEAAALAFGELVANAMRHCPPGEVVVALRWEGPAPVLCVKDCGHGFDPNPCLPEHGQIGGRGLYIVRELAGPVRVQKLQDGCLVSVRLPRSPEAAIGT